MVRMPFRASVLLGPVVFLFCLCSPVSFAQDSSQVVASSSSLTADQVVDNLVRRNSERAADLKLLDGTRTYHLAYKGFPSSREADMVVSVHYVSPSSKEFRILSSSGSKLIVDRVFQKLLEGEREAASPENQQKTALDRSNYSFALVSYEKRAGGGDYVLTVTPRRDNKFLYRGRVWVDDRDFAVTRIEAEPAKNPSFWTKRNEIHHEYEKVGEFWVPEKNVSESWVRLGGHATLTIQYQNYSLNGSTVAESNTSSASDLAAVHASSGLSSK